jgi:hypothetical protein
MIPTVKVDLPVVFQKDEIVKQLREQNIALQDKLAKLESELRETTHKMEIIKTQAKNWQKKYEENRKRDVDGSIKLACMKSELNDLFKKYNVGSDYEYCDDDEG